MREIERGYDAIEVAVRVPGGEAIVIAKTFASSSLSDSAPDRSYVATIVDGAKEHGLPASYIDGVLKPKDYGIEGAG